MTRSPNLRSRVSDRRWAAGKSARALGFSFLLLMAVGGLAEARDRWVSHGPYGGSTAVLLPSVEPGGGLYAGVLGYGVYKVAAGSNAWEERAQGLDNLLVEALVLKHYAYRRAHLVWLLQAVEAVHREPARCRFQEGRQHLYGR